MADAIAMGATALVVPFHRDSTGRVIACGPVCWCFRTPHLLRALQRRQLRPARPAEQVQDLDETDDLLRLGLHRLPITQSPRLRSLAAALRAYDGVAELDEGLTIVLAGLRSQLRT